MQSAKRFLFLGASAALLGLGASCHDSGTQSGATELAARTSSALTSDGGGAAPASPTISGFVVYAANTVSLGSGDHTLGGDVGVATSNGASPSLTVGGLDGLDVLHTLFAPTVSIGSGAVVGAIKTSALTNNGGLVGQQTAFPASMPPLPLLFAPSPGPTNLSVASGQQLTLTPGSYGALSDNGLLFLQPGTYSFSSVTLGNTAQIQALQGGSTSILVSGSLSTGTFCQIFPIGQQANALTISVGGSDAASPAVNVGANSQIVSLLAATNGSVSFGSTVQATGAFAALNVTAGSGVSFVYQSGFPVETPGLGTFLAYAELGLMLGKGVQSVGGDMGVGVVGATSGTAQLVVGSQDLLDPSHTLYAPSISIAAASSVGDVATNTLQNSGGRFGAQVPYPIPMPLLPLALGANPSSNNITVSAGLIRTLTPGSYGALIDNGLVNLNPGAYSFSNVTLGNNAQLVALQGGTTSVFVGGTFSTGSFAQVLPLAQPAGSLNIAVAGNDGTAGAPPAAAFGANSVVVGLLDVPNGTLAFGTAVHATGAFGAFNLSVGDNSALVFQTGLPSAGVQPAGQQQLTGYVTGASVGGVLVGPVPQSKAMRLAMSLPVRVPSSGVTLANYAQQVSDPTSANYRKFLSDTDYETQYQPTAASYTNLTTLAQSSGLTILNANTDNEILDLSGTAAQVSQMTFATYYYYQRPDGSQFFAPDRQPSLAMTEPVLHIAGTDSYILPRPSSGNPGTAPQPGHGSRSDLQGADFRNAYISACASTATGAGQSIGLMEFEGYNPVDIGDYFSANPSLPPFASIPAYTFAAGSAYQFVDSLGGVSQSIGYVGSAEAPVDIEVAWSMAPKAQIVVYQAPTPSEWGAAFADDMMDRMAHPSSEISRVYQFSSSWFFAYDSAEQQALDAMSSFGQSFFLASGDGGAMVYNGYQNSGTSAPADIRVANNVTLVGGTNLLSFGGNKAPTEEVWDVTGPGAGTNSFPVGYPPGSQVLGGGGGGYWGPIPPPGSGYSTTPGYGFLSYQTALITSANRGSRLYRNFPDVSMVAENIGDIVTVPSGTPLPNAPASCVVVNKFSCSNGAGCCCSNTTTGPLGIQIDLGCSGVDEPGSGTSAASPMWAAFMALANQKATTDGVATVGYLNPVVYPMASTGSSLYSTCFNDVTSGSNAPVPGAYWGTTNWHGGAGDANQVAFQESAGLPAAGFPAVKGYDLATGLGSPTCTLITQLASPTPTVPVPPPAPPSTVPPSFVGVGPSDSCGIVSGALECWGDNNSGEEGNGSTSQQLSPVCGIETLSGDVPMSSVAMGSAHACGVFREDGDVWCWGDNSFGQLGSLGVDSMGNTLASSDTAVSMEGVPPAGDIVTEISAGGGTTCALMGGQSVWCWGENDQGQLGNGSVGGGANPTPTEVAGLPPAAQVEVSPGGAFVCALLQSGGIDCWGGNVSGNLGDQTLTQSATPQPVDGISNATSIAVGTSHACAVVTAAPGSTPTNQLWCWGDNGAGELGEGSTNSGSIPTRSEIPVIATQVSGCTMGCPPPVEVTAVACGDQFTCVLVPGGKAECWGDNSVGQLGDGMSGSSTSTASPQNVSGLSGVTAIFAGPEQVCAQMASGALECWGQGPVGNGQSGDFSTPQTLTFARCM
jgi:hypothetical protein